MAENKALAELQSLEGLQGEALDARANLAKLQETRHQRVPQEGETESDFALPEAGATALAAGFVLGPVGGLLMGLAQGFLIKDERQNILDQFAAENEALGNANNVFNDQIERYALTATAPEDIDQLSGLQSQKDAAMELMMSGSPELQEMGSAMLQEFSTEMNAYAVRQEEQRIEADIKQKEMQRELTNTQQSIQSGLRDDYDAQSAGYETILQGSNNAKEMIARGNPVDIVAALIQVNKALDPTSVVRPEEAKALGNVGTKIEQWTQKVDEWAGSGLPLSMSQRKDLMTLVEGIEKTARGFQMQRDIRFQDRAVKDGLPAKYVNEFRRVDDLPAFRPGDLKDREGPVEENVNQVGKVLHDYLGGTAASKPRSVEEMARTNPRAAAAQEFAGRN